MTCGCPDAVTATLRRTVQDELDKAKAILRKTGLFNSAVGDSVGAVGADLDQANSEIPLPLALDVSSVGSYLTCPLLPLAIGVQAEDLFSLDQTALFNKIKGLGKGELDQARKNYDVNLESSSNAKLIKIARTYVKELLRIDFNQITFARAVLISATVLQLCGQEEYTEGPYQEFANIASQISFSGGVPSGLSPNAAAIVSKLLIAEAKFKALRAQLA
jgi:hypothetical protein